MTQASRAEPSNLKAALWMTGWLSAMLMLLVAGREGAREVDLFEMLEIRSLVGLVMLVPMIALSGVVAFAGLDIFRP